MKKYPEIDSFRHVVQHVQKYHVQENGQLPTLNFTGTVKLHGSNLAVKRTHDGFVPQSRNNIISAEKDMYGFASWLDTVSTDLKCIELFNKISTDDDDDLIIFGEWIGASIQKGVAVNQLPNRHWVIFAVWLNNKFLELSDVWQIPELNIYNVNKAGFYNIVVDFNDPQASIAEIESITLDIENCCPYGKLFNITGTGEGVAWKCSDEIHNPRLWFKSKGEKHSGTFKKKHKKKIATITPEKLQSINDLLDEILPSWRLEQGISYLKENNIDIVVNNLGKYLAWIGQDVKKEESDTIAANDLEWKDITKYVTLRAKDFYNNQLNIY